MMTASPGNPQKTRIEQPSYRGWVRVSMCVVVLPFVVTIVVAGLSIWLPLPIADRVVLTILLFPLIFVALFYWLFMAERFGRMLAFMLALTTVHLVIVAAQFL